MPDRTISRDDRARTAACRYRLRTATGELYGIRWTHDMDGNKENMFNISDDMRAVTVHTLTPPPHHKRHPNLPPARLSPHPSSLALPLPTALATNIYTPKIDGVVCPPNISETVAGGLTKLAHRQRIASTTIKLIKKNLTVHFINFSKNNSANRR